MDISAPVYALVGAILTAVIAGVFNAHINRKMLKQQSKDKLISTAYEAATSEFSAHVGIFHANPDAQLKAFVDYLVYHLAFIQGISGGNEFIYFDDKSILAAIDRAKKLSSLREVRNTNSRTNT